MKTCPKCFSSGRVIETRFSNKKGGCKRRRIKCFNCGFRWSTYGFDTKEVDRILDAEGLPTYTEALKVLEALAVSGSSCATIDRIAIVKAFRLLDRFKCP
jgi:transcriptional regulator NrdR family protein